jgi:hypothetical protein
VREHQPSLIKEYGGILDLPSHNVYGRSGANSLLQRSSFVKRKLQGQLKICSQFEKYKIQFLDLLSTTIVAHQIPEELVMNIDKT